MKPPAFVLSLDFELFWGVLESKTLASYGDHVLGVHQALPAMLDLFATYDAKATFATVGFLFYKNSENLRAAWPAHKPAYQNTRLSSYDFPFQDGPHFFAPELVRQLTQAPSHEIATHTFSHYYCQAAGADPASFRVDLEAALKAGSSRGIEQTSIVFPRNQVAEAYLEVCRQLGVSCYRGNQSSWVYATPERSLPGKALRLLDSYLNLSGHNCHRWEAVRRPDGLFNVPASAMLRPHRSRFPWLDGLQLARVEKAMEHAASTGSIYHLWWHPHNFGIHQHQNLKNLEAILRVYRRLAERSGMQSMTMREVAECSAR